MAVHSACRGLVCCEQAVRRNFVLWEGVGEDRGANGRGDCFRGFLDWWRVVHVLGLVGTAALVGICIGAGGHTMRKVWLSEDGSLCASQVRKADKCFPSMADLLSDVCTMI